MTTLIAVDGDYLNRALRSKALSMQDDGKELPESGGKPRLRIDFERFAELLSDPYDLQHEDVILNYYTDEIKIDDEKIIGRVTKYWSDRGYGFIAGVDGTSFFFHNKDVLNKGLLRKSGEKKYPHPSSHEFANRIRGKVVSFKIVEGEDANNEKAVSIYIEKGSVVDKFYELRREPFLAMLEETGYTIARCTSGGSCECKGKNKIVDCRIYLDAMRELAEEEDRLVLVSDDHVFKDLIEALQEDGILTTVALFRGKDEDLLCETANNFIMIDDHLSSIQFEYGLTEKEETVTL
jgi:uncharacterized LabA/DUF88 family protein